MIAGLWIEKTKEVPADLGQWEFFTLPAIPIKRAPLKWKSSHGPAAVIAAFDDPNLIAHAGLVPVIRLAERCGPPALVAEKVRLTGAKNGAGTAADAKAMSVVGGMTAGADSIENLDVLRHGGLPKLFGGVRAPSTLGTFLRAFIWGHVRQLESVARAFTCHLAAHTGLVPQGYEVMFVDTDSKVKWVNGPAKQGASFGYTKVRGLHFQIVTVKTSTCAPVIVAARLRKGLAGSGKCSAAAGSAQIEAPSPTVTVRSSARRINGVKLRSQ
ncbi:hypothetical protein [Streptomyces niveus]|uniref:hypothetical protein n=1 Tax=Streptomyces niveus TaxID=193462 RepID=UPI00364779ED